MAKLNRVYASKNLEANIYYKGVEAVDNGFDAKKPWSEIEEIEDANGNVWIKIPKFYTKYVVEDGIIKERYVSEYNCGKEWHLNPVFLNTDGEEVDCFLVSKYQLSMGDSRAYSISGTTPATDKLVGTMRTAVGNYNNDNDGYTYSLFDIWALIALQDLCLVEFATSNVTSIMQGKVRSSYNGNIATTGTLDAIGGKTNSGSAAASLKNDNGNYCMKYRGIENLWGNGRTFVDGIYGLNDKFYYETDNSKYGNYSTYKTADLPTFSVPGYVHQLGFDSESKLVFPVTVDSSGSYGDYCTSPTTQSTPRVIFLGGEKEGGENGLFSFINGVATSTLDNSVFRMVKKPQ